MASGNTILAKALYDNLAETADELEFRRGDMVTIIEQNTSGLEGWWLCSLNGRQGIAPGNRLRIIPIMHSSGITQSPVAKPMFTDEDEEYDIPTHSYPTNLNNNNNDPNDVYDVPAPRKYGSRPELDQDEDDVYDVPPQPVLQPSFMKSSQENLLTSSPQHRTVTIDQEVYDVPFNLIATGSQSINISSELDPNELYDVPPIRVGGPHQDPEEVYDVPPNRLAVSPNSSLAVWAEQLDVSAMLEQEEEEDEEYDVPPLRPHVLGSGMIQVFQASTPASKSSSFNEPSSPDAIYDVPSSRLAEGSFNTMNSSGSLNLSNFTSKSATFSPGNRSLLKQESEDYVYDVPPQVTRDQPIPMLKPGENESLDAVIWRLSLSTSHSGAQERRSTASSDSLSSIIAANAKYRELNLELSSAVDKLIKLKQSLEDSVSNLLTHVYEGWRLKENISGKIGIIKSIFESVLVNVAQYVEFARGAMANANAAQERGLSSTLPRSLITGMHKLLQPLEEDNLMLQQANDTLNNACWSLSKLVSEDTDIGVPDEIDSFVMTSRAVSDDARQMAAYIHTHAQYLFKRVESRFLAQNETPKASAIIQTRPLPDLPPPQIQTVAQVQNQQPVGESWLEDYDYVSLEEQNSPEMMRRQSPNIMSSDTKHREVLQVLEMSNHQHGVPRIIGDQAVESNVTDDHFTLQDMVEDVPIIVNGLVDAIKVFYSSIDSSEPPKTFVALSKQVILCAHELVFFGDSIYRRLQHEKMQEIVKGHCTNLCTSLKRTVAATKNAAQQWPSVLAVQEMVDRVTDISRNAHQFRILLSQCTVR